MMTKITWILGFFIFNMQVNAAIPAKNRDAVSVEKKLLKNDIEVALTALQLPSSNRNKALQSQGVRSLSALQAIAQDPKQSLTMRWRATTSLGRIFPKESLTFLTRLTGHPDWFMRNSSLLALQVASPATAISAAEKLLVDKSLIVRTAAVQVMVDLKASRAKPKLWEALNSKQNFRGEESLWVRQHIMKALAQTSQPQDMSRFTKALNDRDLKVQLWAMHGLERLTKNQDIHQGLSFQERKNKWLAWAQNQGQL